MSVSISYAIYQRDRECRSRRDRNGAAQVIGPRVWTRLRVVILPAAGPAAAAGALPVFMSAYNELTVSALLWSTGVETIGVGVFTLQYEGNSPAAAALATTTVVVTRLLALLADIVARRFAVAAVPWGADV